jgi:dTDP-4-amino-4,6-dideoxygalactose transaminase
MITKKPENITNLCRNIFYFKNARSALKKVMMFYINRNPKSVILLPSFIGLSPKEGSGILDPVLDVNIQYEFYSMTDEIFVDIEKIEYMLQAHKKNGILLLVHYWGYVDPNFDKVVELCKKYEIKIVEDAAHALYTDVMNANDKSDIDFTIYSLHKMFPVDDGGVIVSYVKDFETNDEHDKFDILKYDVAGIAAKRMQHAKFWERELEGVKKVKFIRKSECFPTCVPQTVPILLDGSLNRYEIYLALNDKGFGAISLYHTLVSQIDKEKFTPSYNVSKSILNLPVHQDVEMDELVKMKDYFIELVE